MLITLIMITACSGGASGPGAPTTVRQANSRLVSATELRGYRISITSQFHQGQQKAGPAFTTARCSSLQTWQLFFGYGPAPVLTAAEFLVTTFAKVISDPLTQEWTGGEDLFVYRGDGAQQVMSGLAQVGARCPGSVVNSAGQSTHIRTTVSKVAGLGDLALDVQARIDNAPYAPTTAADWIVVRSGNCLLMLYEDPTGVSMSRYLLAAARAAWHAYAG